MKLSDDDKCIMHKVPYCYLRTACVPLGFNHYLMWGTAGQSTRVSPATTSIYSKP